MLTRAIRLQAVYYVVTGLWALVHRRSFERVTGPKADYWLVRTVGLLATAIGGALGIGSRRCAPTRETRALAVAAGLAFTASDLVYALRGRISRVYLMDVVAHAALACLAALSLRRSRRR